MSKAIRNAVRCYIINNDEILCIKYLKDRVGFYDIPGGKIEEGETPKDTVYRECLEETGLEVKNPKYRGTMYVDYPDKSYIFKTFITNEYIGEPKNFDENTSQWIKINDLILEKNRFLNTLLLEKEFINAILNEGKIFELYIKCDSEENIIEMSFKYV